MMKKRINNKQSSVMIKKYIALLNQSGLADPIATVLNSSDVNYLGDIVWVRVAEGAYDGTLINAFPLDKTSMRIDNIEAKSVAWIYSLGQEDNSQIEIVTYNNISDENRADGILYNCIVEITVYP